MTDPRPREQMTPEALATRMETSATLILPEWRAIVAHLRQLAIRDRDAEYIIARQQNQIAALEAENARLAELVRQLGGQP